MPSAGEPRVAATLAAGGPQPGERAWILALDLGEKNVGVAVSDELELTANPRSALRRDATTLDRVLRLMAEEEIGEVVVGLPLLMSGEEGTQAKQAREFADALTARAAVPVAGTSPAP